MDKKFNYKEMLTDFIKFTVNYAFSHNMEFFYISCPYNVNPSIGGVYIVKHGNKEFFSKVKGYFGASYVITKTHWNIHDVLEFLGSRYDIPLKDLI